MIVQKMMDDLPPKNKSFGKTIPLFNMDVSLVICFKSITNKR